MPLTARPDFRGPPGTQPGQSLEQLRAQALDGFGTQRRDLQPALGHRRAVLRGHGERALPRHERLARARNGWTGSRGCAPPSSCAPHSAGPGGGGDRALRRRPALRPVLLPAMTEMPLGRRAHRPIFAAAEKHGLAVDDPCRRPVPPSADRGAAGASFHAEDHAAQAQVFQAQLLSLVYEGVFVDHPGAARRAAECRDRLAAGLPVARQQDLARRCAPRCPG